MSIDREFLGRLVRRVWVQWAYEQPSPKSSWTAVWEDIPEPMREVDMRIGEKVAEVSTALAVREVERLRAINAKLLAACKAQSVIVDAQDKLLVCYRIGRNPSEKVLSALGKREEIEKQVADAIREAEGGGR